jgi:hypothetical protein
LSQIHLAKDKIKYNKLDAANFVKGCGVSDEMRDAWLNNLRRSTRNQAVVCSKLATYIETT